MIKLIEKIEGEAKLNFSFKDRKIDYVDIEFMSTRSIEEILKGKTPQDALVINPRVCGICGHAHLIATVKALESCYDSIEISKKAEIIRELTLNFELIQNHFKWFYLTMLPLLGKKQDVVKGIKPAQILSKAIATVGGQYPHTSYAVVGGIVSEVTSMDLIKIERYIDEVIDLFKTQVVSDFSEDFLTCNDVRKLFSREGDLPEALEIIKKNQWQDLGKSYDRFIAFGENSYFKSGKSVKTRANYNLHLNYVKEYENPNSFGKNVLYRDKYYEVGPLARAMVKKTPIIKDSHRKYGDSMFSRVLARVCEIPQLLLHSKELLEKIDLNEPSYIKPNISLKNLTGEGCSAIEAARGSLIHKVELENGIIKNYEIITPTQWNLAGGTREKLGISQKAMIGLENGKMAETVFKTFDVCSVCTTH
ncbi:MAG: nickel-dependent hydrogenase large subunit [Campylobacterales bacterium]|nr:nickel-dependent hydrogenase large subunit [Campylobacterales bacterium]